MLTSERIAAIVADYREGVADAPVRKGLTAENIAKGPAAAARLSRERGAAAHANLIGPMRELRRQGLTLRAIAAALNAEGYRTQKGRAWKHANVQRVLATYV